MPRRTTMANRLLRYPAAAASLLSFLLLTGPAGADVVTQTQHVRLGFSSSFPISDTRSDSVTCASYSFSVDGAANLAVNMGADITFSYDRKDIVPGGNVPIQITYTPTNDDGPELSVNAAADVTMDVDVDD